MNRFLKRARWLSLIALIVLTIIFIGQNAALVELKFLHFTVEARRAYVVGTSILMGALVGWIFGAAGR